MDLLRSKRAKALCKAKLEARKALDEAYEKYQHALAVGMDMTDASEEEMLAIRREGRAYAHALTHYTSATMAWLQFVDAQLHPKAREREASSD